MAGGTPAATSGRLSGKYKNQGRAGGSLRVSNFASQFVTSPLNSD